MTEQDWGFVKPHGRFWGNQDQSLGETQGGYSNKNKGRDESIARQRNGGATKEQPISMIGKREMYIGNQELLRKRGAWKE